MGRIVPIYEAIGGISSRMMRRIIYSVLLTFESSVARSASAEIFASGYRFPTRREALLYVAFPAERREHRTAEQLSQPGADAADLRGVFLLSACAGAAPSAEHRQRGIAYARARAEHSAKRSSAFCPSSRLPRRSECSRKSRRTSNGRARCTGCSKATWAAAKRSSRSKPRQS